MDELSFDFSGNFVFKRLFLSKCSTDSKDSRTTFRRKSKTEVAEIRNVAAGGIFWGSK